MRLATGAGGECLWQFPVPEHLGRADRKEILAAWDKLHGDKAAEQLLRQLVLAIRMWQPDVVLTESSGRRGSTGRPGGGGRPAAFERAADPKVFPEQIDKLGLQAWAVKKLYARSERPAKNTPVVLDLMDVRPRLQATARDFAAGPAALLTDAPPSLPARQPIWLLASRIAGAAEHRNLMDGIDLEFGGKARRKLEEQPKPDDEVLKAVRLRRNLESLAQTPLAGLTDPDRLLGEIGRSWRTCPTTRGQRPRWPLPTSSPRPGSGAWPARPTCSWSIATRPIRYPSMPIAG